MTRFHATLKLLEHGALAFREFREITGWTPSRCRHALYELQDRGQVRQVKFGVWGLV